MGSITQTREHCSRVLLCVCYSESKPSVWKTILNDLADLAVRFEIGGRHGVVFAFLFDSIIASIPTHDDRAGIPRRSFGDL